MNFIRIVTFFCLGSSACFPSAAFAWWDMGHMQIAAVAYEHLDPAAKEKADALIKLNPKYQDWIAGISDEQKAEAAFVHAATWPDDIKSDKTYHYDKVTDPTAARNLGYSDMIVHDYWHYVDVPFSTDGTIVKAPPIPNALTEIELMTKTLDSGASNEVKSYDLVWLLHLVGDVHQPLHATERYSKPLGDDRGGNDESVTTAEGSTIPLHAYWDGILGDRGIASQAIGLAHQLPIADPQESSISDPSIWVIESFAVAQDDVYTSLIGLDKGPFQLDQAYEAHALAVAKARAAIAGMRLANLLNGALH